MRSPSGDVAELGHAGCALFGDDDGARLVPAHPDALFPRERLFGLADACSAA